MRSDSIALLLTDPHMYWSFKYYNVQAEREKERREVRCMYLGEHQQFQIARMANFSFNKF